MSFWRKIAGLAVRGVDEAECDVCPPGLPGEDPAFSTAVTALGAKLANGTAARGAQAYVRTTVNGGLAIGGIEDNTTSSGLVAPALLTFTGPADAAGNVELAVGIPY